MAKAVVTFVALAHFFTCLLSTPTGLIPKGGACGKSDSDNACSVGLICSDAGFCDEDNSNSTSNCGNVEKLIDLMEDFEGRMDDLEERFLNASTPSPTTTTTEGPHESFNDLIARIKNVINDRFKNIETRFGQLTGSLTTTATEGSNAMTMTMTANTTEALQVSANATTPATIGESSTDASTTSTGSTIEELQSESTVQSSQVSTDSTASSAMVESSTDASTSTIEGSQSASSISESTEPSSQNSATTAKTATSLVGETQVTQVSTSSPTPTQVVGPAGITNEMIKDIENAITNNLKAYLSESLDAFRIKLEEELNQRLDKFEAQINDLLSA